MTSIVAGLKEWAVVVEALLAGDQLILLRKGGIMDVGAEFRLEADRFVLWPTYYHQSDDWLAPAHQARLEPAFAARGNPDDVPLRGWATVTDLVAAPSRASLNRLANEHVWSDDYLDQRWSYRPELPLHVVVLRVHRLTEAVVVRELPEHQGCRSWVDLPTALAPDGSPVVASTAFETRRKAVMAALR